MVRFCAIFGCTNRSNRESEKRYFSFPGVRDNRGRDLPDGIRQREAWIKIIRRADLTAEKIRNASVCSDHFLKGFPAQPDDVNNPDYTPSQNLGYTSAKKVEVGATGRHHRARKRLLNVPVQEDLPPEEPTSVELTSVPERNVVDEASSTRGLSDLSRTSQPCISREYLNVKKLVLVEVSDFSFENGVIPPLDIKSDIELQEDDINQSFEEGSEYCETLLKENKRLNEEVKRLTKLVDELKQELLLSRHKEIKFEQIVLAVKDLVNEDIQTAAVKLEI